MEVKNILGLWHFFNIVVLDIAHLNHMVQNDLAECGDQKWGYQTFGENLV